MFIAPWFIITKCSGKVQMSISWWIGWYIQITWYYEWTMDTCGWTDAKWKKPDTKDSMLYYPIYVKFLAKAKLCWQNADEWFPGAGSRSRMDFIQAQGNFWRWRRCPWTRLWWWFHAVWIYSETVVLLQEVILRFVNHGSKEPGGKNHWWGWKGTFQAPPSVRQSRKLCRLYGSWLSCDWGNCVCPKPLSQETTGQGRELRSPLLAPEPPGFCQEPAWPSPSPVSLPTQSWLVEPKLCPDPPLHGFWGIQFLAF